MASRPTKYAHVVSGLPKYLGEDEDRLTLLNKLRDEIRATTVNDETDYNISAQLMRSIGFINGYVGKLLDFAKKCPGVETSAGLVRAYHDARFTLAAIAEWRSSAQLLVDAYERMMTDQMEVDGIRSVSLAMGGGVSTSQEPYGKVIDKEGFRRWCVAPADVCMDCGERESAPWHSEEPSGTDPQIHHFHPGGGLESKLQLWPSSMEAIVKERALKGDRQPDGIEVTVKTVVRLNKA